MKRVILILVVVVLVVAVWFWGGREGGGGVVDRLRVARVASAVKPVAAQAAGHSFSSRSVINTNRLADRFVFRLTNTSKDIGELQRDPQAVLLENAFIDTSRPLTLTIPARLQAVGDPGAYIVQAHGTINGAFRALLASAGAQVVSYIPNNAYLVRLNAGGASTLAGDPLVQAVLPYEPYYKISSTAPVKLLPTTASVSPKENVLTNTTTLLELAVEEQPLPPGTFLTLGLFGDTAAATMAQIKKLGGNILSEDRTPFGKLVRVAPPVDWVALASLPGVQLVEPAYRRKLANDLARVAVGVSTDTVTNASYLNLTGKNVLVEVNDTGIDPTHPDFSATGTAAGGPNGATRVFGDSAGSLFDTAGHGTHVAGIIAGNGSRSINPTNIGAILQGLDFGSVSNADFRGKAPLAMLYSVGGVDGGNDSIADSDSDSYFQEQPALTNALISNNSWANDGDNAYDLSAASYDAAVRDALPGVTGEQPVLFVFAAGNDGQGDDGSGAGGNPDSITSPGTAKNVVTVGALQQLRNITNVVTIVQDGTTNTSTPWSAETSTSYQVAGYSSRGNVGIGIEGTYGRFKPDVTAPGTFVVSTRSSMWDTNAYYNPTNYDDSSYTLQTVTTNLLDYYSAYAPPNAVGVAIQIVPNAQSTFPFPTNLPLYASLNGLPTTNSYDIFSSSNRLAVPPQSGGAISSIAALQGNVFNLAVGDDTSNAVNFDLDLTIATTNDVGNYYEILAGLNGQIGPWYRYETGTSMATPSVSGVLALMQDYFTNTLHAVPSPALLKALVINGARATGYYDYQVQNSINYQGWGLVNLPDSIPPGMSNGVPASGNVPEFFLDQSLTNALATGDSRTFKVALAPGAVGQPLRVTLAWTDPPGNPAAAIKLVNNLELVVTNLDDPTNPIIFYGNDFAAGNVFNTPESTNVPASSVVDTINNVQNVYISGNVGTNFSVTVIGLAVNVNAVNAQTNDAISGTYAPNIVQDYALVVTGGDGSSANGFAVSSFTQSTNPTNDQNITIIATNNAPLLNQMAGASSPLLGTNATMFAVGSAGELYGPAAVVTIGQTNQWHFYIVTNNGLDVATGLVASKVPNAAFITFSPDTLATPRAGVFAGLDANSTLPEANLDLFVTTDSNLLTLSPLTISNCINGVQVGATVGSAFQGSALARGGSKYVVDTNSAVGEVYYVGVKSEDQVAAEYDYFCEFSSQPFSLLDTNGNETVSFFPVNIPDGNATLPGYTNTIGLAIFPLEVQKVVVTNVLAQQNVGDLVISLNHSTAGTGNGSVVLLNHDSPNSPGIYTFIYDDSGQNPVPGSQPSDGPGNLNSYATQQGNGIWVLHASDNAPGFTGSMQGTLFLQRHQNLGYPFLTVSIAPQSWFYGYVSVTAGYTNLNVFAVDETPLATPGDYLTLAQKLGALPTLTDNDASVLLDINCLVPPGLSNSISTGPPLAVGTYYVGVYNPDTVTHTVEVGATLVYSASAISTVTYDSTDTPLPLLDDAVTTDDSIQVTNRDSIQDILVGLRVDHPRISDLAFTLISPIGDRYLLMENRGGASTNGCGATVLATNMVMSDGFDKIPGGTTPGMGSYIDGWLISNGNVDICDAGDGFNADGSADSPPNCIDLNGWVAGTIITNFNTVVGQQYVLSFAYTKNPSPANPPGFIASAEIDINGNLFTQLSTLSTLTNSYDYLNWSHTSYVFAASSTSTALQFKGLNVGDAGMFLDTIQVGITATNNLYLTFTEDTNLTVTPIKFAPVPLVPPTTQIIAPTNFILSDFESATAGDYVAPTNLPDESVWQVISNQVSVVTDTNNAYQGSNFLALANGVISNNVPTIPGIQYTVTFNYRGPGIVGFWRGESNAVDSVGDNNGTLIGGTGYAPAEVGMGFGFTNIGDQVSAPATNLPVGTSDRSIDCWVYINSFINNDYPLFAGYGNVGSSGGVYQLGIYNDHRLYFSQWGQDVFGSALNLNQWYHVAVTSISNTITLYLDGTNVGSGTLPFSTPADSQFFIGGVNVPPGNGLKQTAGLVDEVSVYNRALSQAEFQAIYAAGAKGKFNPAISLPQSLAEAQINLNGQAPIIFYGNNTSWQQQTITFIATQTNTPLVISGIEPGMLLDSFSVSSAGGGANLYYQPEQPLTPLIGTSARGTWQLEILDSRTGATNNATLDSWQIQFTFANTNLPTYTVGNLVGGIPQTGSIVISSNNIAWYAVDVPTNANDATNLLLFATNLPVNVWFSTNYPPTITNTGDMDIIPNATSGSKVLSAVSTPAIVPGGVYYLGVQIPSGVAVSTNLETYTLQVNFDHGNATNSNPQLMVGSVTVSGGELQFQWTGSSTAQYEILWTTNLVTPMSTWNVTTAGITSSGGVFTFTDSNLTNAARYYRLEQVAP